MPKIIPQIPKKFEKQFPEDFDNRIQYWGFFGRRDLEDNRGRLLMLDIDFGRYCSLDCPTCFRKSNVVDDVQNGDLSYEELLHNIDEAKELGLRSLKICGAGEPTENTRFLQFIREMSERDVGVAVFTKGQVLSSDEKTRQFNKRYGISSAQQLCEELYQYKVSFMLSFQSFDSAIQDSLVRKEGHTILRNQALENLVNAGFNNPNPTRLALVNAPLTREIYDEAFDIYVYARERNIYPVTAVLMVSGKQIDQDFLKRRDVTREEKIDLWSRIYSWNIEHGLQTLNQIKEEGVSVMPGIHPCNQVTCGLYLTAKGNVVGCPGFGAREDIEGNVRRDDLDKIWVNSKNKRERSGVFNCHCPPKDGITIPSDLYQVVLTRLETKYGKPTN